MYQRPHYPRPEYPRPDRQRGLLEGIDWINLNGPWQFRFDGDRSGLDERWFDDHGVDWREQITVPFCWESLAAWGDGNAANNENYYSTRIFRNPLEVTRSNHRQAARYEVGWYRREIAVPDDWRDRRIILHVGAADFFTDCWCNGIHLGGHEGGYTAFEFDITDSLQESQSGTASIVLRVEDPMDNNEQPVGKQWKWYTTVSGIWQTVFLEPRATAYIDHFRIATDIATGVVDFSVACLNAFEGAPLEVEITSPSGQLDSATIHITSGISSRRIWLSSVALWDPADPQLYRVVLRLKGRPGQPDDVVRTYFGMRKISTAAAEQPDAPARLCLNDEPIYLRGALYQSYYPDGVYTAGDAQVLRNDIAFAKQVGFSFLRVHLKLDDPLLLYYADTMGILLMEDFPNFGEGGDTPLGRSRFETMLREGLQRDWNHPSIIAWCLFNETWGFGGQVELVKHFGGNTHGIFTEPGAPKLENKSSQLWVQQMWELAKSLDPTRLVEDMSVVHWEHVQFYAHGDTDINSWHFYIDDYERAKAHIENVVKQTYAGSAFNYEAGYVQGNQPLINSEYGGVGALDGDRDISWSFKFLTNELRLHEHLSAYIYTELHDVEWEYNGFLNYDRTPKTFGYDPVLINQGDVLPIDAPPIQRCAPGERKEVEIYASHFSRETFDRVFLFWRLSGVDSLGHITQNLALGRTEIPFRRCRVELAHRVELVLPQEWMLCTLWVDAFTSEGTAVASNFVQFFVTPETHPDREELPQGIVLRGTTHQWSHAEWSGGLSDPLEVQKTGTCFGLGHGFFEWELKVTREELAKAKRLRVLCEASSRRMDMPQTDAHRYPTTCDIHLNGVCIHNAVLPDHPHDSRGALSYLHGGKGGYGYLLNVVAEGELLRAIRESASEGTLSLRCGVPKGSGVEGGLSIYGGESGRYPIGPTVIAEW